MFLKSASLASFIVVTALQFIVEAAPFDVACNLSCDGQESGASCECLCGGDHITAAFPLSYCGIEQLPDKYGFKHVSSSASIEYEGDATQVPIIDEENEPFFGNSHGNFQPSDDAFEFEPVATGGQVSNPKVAVTSINNKDGIGSGKDSYTLYLGNGSSFPKESQWVSFENMFNNSKKAMLSSCKQYKMPNDDESELSAIYDAIQQVAKETKVDHRFILAIIMQESGGCVRVPTSNFGVRNPGLMQDHNGAATCNSDITHKVQNPCPSKVILEMIREGTAGTKSGDGLAQCINESKAGDVTAFYKAARIYNSGEIAPSGNLQDGTATYCYASDVANRLTGWIYSPHKCNLDDPHHMEVLKDGFVDKIESGCFSSGYV
ncbi:hypothetical protein N431DRAFT_464865 [Stipitochalara longipes BDJ]|nr:hypothetical protein N431DRAFT_464865 [Stipitochalara longipes BDJ]